jgi:hypothetical protein
VRDDDLGVYIAWTTRKGMFVGHVSRQDENHFPLLYELAGGNEIVSQPTYLPSQTGDPALEGVIFVASLNGSVYAHSARQGVELWKRATGQPIVEPVIPIGNHLYVASELGGMYCLDTANGKQLWHAPRITKFIAASPTRIYAADKTDRLLVLDAESGAKIDALPFAAADIMVHNMRTDRIYLVAKTGLIQCLREIELTQPARHNVKVQGKPKEKAQEQPQEKPQAEPQTQPQAKTKAKPKTKPQAKPKAKPQEKPQEKPQDNAKQQARELAKEKAKEKALERAQKKAEKKAGAAERGKSKAPKEQPAPGAGGGENDPFG